MNKDLTEKRLKVLEGHIRKDIDLLDKYKDELRYESDPRRMAKYRSEIERQRESLSHNQQEYDELQEQVTPAEIQNITDLLQQIGAKLDEFEKTSPEIAVNRFLDSGEFPKRSFTEIKRRFGGFEDEELRKILVGAGAVRYTRRKDGAELWGLLSRNPP